jgi:hypothetical protein
MTNTVYRAARPAQPNTLASLRLLLDAAHTKAT